MSGSRLFDRRGLIEAFDAIGTAAIANGTRLELAVYGGGALMLASNFRFATEDVDIAEIGKPWPSWLADTVYDIAERNGWSSDWLNDAVTLHLSPLADQAADHVEFGSFPRAGPPGLDVLVPTAAYLLALKLKAMRITDAAEGEREAADIRGLMQTLDVDADGAIAVLHRYYDALVGGIAEYLFKRWTPDHPPRWIGDRSRYLEWPWFPHAREDPALMEYLTFASPAEFKSRNVMTDEEPLRRANTPRA